MLLVHARRLLYAHRDAGHSLVGVRFLILVWFTAGCSQAINPALVMDAQLATRIKTTIVNDPVIGPRAIEARATGGVARLSGRVHSDEEAKRLIDLVRSVPGVTDVQSSVLVGMAPPPAASVQSRRRPLTGGESMEPPDDPQLLAVGGSLGWTNPRTQRLYPRADVGLLVRLGSGRGLGPAIGFNWFRADLHEGRDLLGQLRVRPIMGGLGYTVRNDRVSATVALVGGIAFNSFNAGSLASGTRVALKADNSLVWRPGVSLWVDVNRRLALNVSAVYLIVRPTVTWLEDGRVTTRPLRADTILVSTGVAYKIF